MKTKEWSARRPQHLLARIICLLLAIITWLCIMRIADPICDGSLTGISIMVLEDEDGAYTGSVENAVTGRIRIRGTKQALAAVKAGDVSAYVDLKDLQIISTPDKDTVTMPLYFKTPEGIEIDGSYQIDVRLQAKG